MLDLWLEAAERAGEPSMSRLARTVGSRRERILAWFEHPVSNGFAEGLNSLIQTTKRVARGYGNTGNFIAMVYLRNGRLDIRFDRAGTSIAIINGAPGERKRTGRAASYGTTRKPVGASEYVRAFDCALLDFDPRN